ncbi:sensor domain-containing diguanylate cyclase [Chitinilyticum piscinae]|uniref:diguanylate cyclase n=1 Tax=Chitinilyticum piscinae TaxID=2866724 RepID=A0A8J7FNN9_9NEIS|nr:diguanylate cyclase [Chitinilyticum piscinae]MBE9610755.1 diguanylate cyclase [Chitinilyticum piscinae]
MNWTHRPPWIITVFALLFCAGVVLILSIQLGQSYRNEQEHARTVAETRAIVLQSQLSSALAQLNLVLGDISQQITPQQLSGLAMSEDERTVLHGLLLDKLTQVRQASNIALINAAGQTTHEALDDQQTHISLPEDDVAMIRNNRYLERVYLTLRPESSSKAPVLLLARRVEDSNGDFAGLIVASIAASYLSPLLEQADAPPNQVIEIQDQEGFPLAALRGITHRSASIPFDLNPDALAESRRQARTITALSPAAAGNRLVSYSAIPDTPLALIVSSAAADYLRQWQRNTMLYLAGGAVLLALALLMSFFFWRSHRLSRNLRSKELKLQASENRFRQVIETTPVALLLARLPDCFVTYINQRAAQLFDLPQAAALSMRALDFFQDRDQFVDLVYYAQNGEPAKNVEVILRRHDGAPLWATLSLSTVTIDEQTVLVIGMNDITERKRLEEELKRRATTDSLSGLANRAHFMERSESELIRSKRYGHPLSLLMLDIDFFKQINDSFGHPAGDQVIQRVAEIARACLRDTDLIARMGGEEFAILLPETALSATLDAAERLRHAIETHLVITPEQHRIRFTTSIGAAQWCEEDQSISDLLKRADNALYQAKQTGRNRVCADN